MGGKKKQRGGVEERKGILDWNMEKKNLKWNLEWGVLGGLFKGGVGNN